MASEVDYNTRCYLTVIDNRSQQPLASKSGMVKGRLSCGLESIHGHLPTTAPYWWPRRRPTRLPMVDTSVETANWRPIKPRDIEQPNTIAFVDGVQRVDTRVLGDLNGSFAYGAFASLGIGVTIGRAGTSTVRPGSLLRVLALTDGASYETVRVPCGSIVLEYESQSTAASGPAAVNEVLLSARRDAETKFAESLSTEGIDLVVVDGRLNSQPTRQSMVVGFIKSTHRQYLQPDEAAVLSELCAGSRTPSVEVVGPQECQ